MIKKIKKCRICKNADFKFILNLGLQKLTGVFPNKNQLNTISKAPLELILCKKCSLVQLNHSFIPEEMYGSNYGYKSSLNQTMIDHLKKKVVYLENKYLNRSNDIVLDIGSNDGTLLNSYSKKVKKIGIDPTINKFKHLYKKKHN